MKLFTTIFIIFTFSIITYSQNYTSEFTNFSKQLKEVTLKKSKCFQKSNSSDKGIVNFYRESVSLKGDKTETEEYIFSIKDINELSVRKFTDRDLIYVQISVINENQYIKCIKNNDSQSYISGFWIYAENSENADLLVASIKNLIGLGKKIQLNTVLPKSLTAGIDWLSANVETCDLGNKQISQTIKKVENKPYSIIISTSVSSKNIVNTYSYEINIADIDPYSVKVEINGNELKVIGDTYLRQQYVKVKKEDKEYFSDGFDIYFNTLDNARNFATVLSDIIPEAKKLYEASLPKMSSVNSIIPLVNKNISKVEFSGRKYDQKISGECMSTIEIMVNDKTDSYTEKYEINLRDFKTYFVPFRFSTKGIIQNLQCENNLRFIKRSKNNVFIAYENNFDIYFDDIDKARESAILLERAIKDCKDNKPEKEVSGNYTQLQDWLKKHISVVKYENIAVEQILEEYTGSEMLRFTVTESTGKTSNHFVYEFKWEDMMETSVELKTTPKQIGISINTKNYAKVINFSKNGEVKNYTNSIYFEFSNIEDCKNALIVIKKLVNFSQNNKIGK